MSQTSGPTTKCCAGACRQMRPLNWYPPAENDPNRQVCSPCLQKSGYQPCVNCNIWRGPKRYVVNGPYIQCHPGVGCPSVASNPPPAPPASTPSLPQASTQSPRAPPAPGVPASSSRSSSAGRGRSTTPSRGGKNPPKARDPVARAAQNNAAGAKYRANEVNNAFLKRIAKPKNNAQDALKKARTAGKDVAHLQAIQNVIDAYQAAHTAYNNYRDASKAISRYSAAQIEGYRFEYERLAQIAENTPRPNKPGRTVVQPAAPPAWNDPSAGFGQFSVAGPSNAGEEPYVGKGKGKSTR